MSTTEPSHDELWMLRALEVGRRGSPSPNPHVGAVIVKDDRFVAEGHHARAGGDHAEIAAIKAASTDLRGATLYVTLEPCNHVGRTGPCVDALLAQGFSRVVVGARDPNPSVEGRGLERLRSAGVEVVAGICQSEAEALIAPWRKHILTRMPYVTLKLALSLDGRIATHTGKSQWITGLEARLAGRALRRRCDAVAVGIGTALADNPLLTVRDGLEENVVRVVFDSHLRLPMASNLVTTAREIQTWAVCLESASNARATLLEAAGVRILRCKNGCDGTIDLDSALLSLASAGIVSLLVEGGGALVGSFLKGRFADELHTFVAPMILGSGGLPAVHWQGPPELALAPRLSKASIERCGADVHIHGPLAYGP